MRFKSYALAALLILCVATVTAFAVHAGQKKQAKPPAASQEMKGMDMDGMNKRGNKVMGFDQMKTTHHFRLTNDGGAIEVEANDINDTASRDEIRMHLSHIARMFAEGNFKAPMLIHDRTPPGVPVMKELKAEIAYKFEETERGARVLIKTKNPKALRAIYDFLRFQIKEHNTGDSLEVSG